MKVQLWSKHMGYKCDAIRNILRNTLVPTKEQKKRIAPKKTQKKKTGPSSGHVEPSHWPHENYGLKTVGHYFQPGVSHPTANGGENRVWVYI